MAMSKKLKSRAAGKDDRINLTCTQFAANQERTEIKVGEGKEFDNDELLRILGFKENSEGVLTLPTVEHKFKIEPDGTIVRGEALKKEKEEEVRA